MKRTTVSALLKCVLVLGALGLLFLLFSCLPLYLRHIARVRPELSGWYGWLMAYGCVVVAPILAALALLWRVFGTIATGRCFVKRNADRFRLMTRLALGDLAVVAAMAVFLLVKGVTPPFLVMVFAGALLTDVVAALVFTALRGLVENAADLQQDTDMTI